MVEVITMAARFCLQELLDAHAPPMSQSELARRARVSLVTVNAIANNRTRQVQLETLDKLASVLGKKPGDLLERAVPRKKRGR